MKRSSALLVLALGCSDMTGEIEVVSPADGTTITMTGPIVFVMRGTNIISGVGGIEGSVDNIHDTSISVPVPDGRCDGCTFMGTWPATSVANGTHVIRFDAIYDGGSVASGMVTLDFQRP